MPRTDQADPASVLPVTDDAGRVLAVRRPRVLQRLLLAEIVGPENARNVPYWHTASLAAALVTIDGVPVPPLAGKPQLEARVGQLGEHGLAAMARALDAEASDDAAAERARPEDLARARLEDHELMLRLSLVRHGMSFRDAFELAPDEPFPLDYSWALTFAIGLGIAKGGQYDWKSGRWRRQ